ncbi:serine hydrolase domain-containing protein [Aquabacterium sp.]|uniref:serine hydrolase domain-containing protein n=1 Tax=Aquabacterium sp. TaxID=1872578 RepID=UPI003D6CE0C0
MLLACLAAMSFTLAGCASSLSEREFDPADLVQHLSTDGENIEADMAALAKPLVDQGQTPGIVVGVLLPDGQMRFFGYGTTNEQGGATPGPDTIFAMGSLSKGFLGAMAAELVNDGQLAWDDTLGDLLPPETPLSSDAKRITLLQLATHTSGLPRQPITFQTCRYFLQYLFTGANFYRHFERDYVFDYLSDFKAPNHHEPNYSNIGYGLLGHVIERRTGQSLETLLDQKIVHGLGLKNTGYMPSTLPGYALRAHGHAGDQPKFVPRGALVPDWEFTDFMRGSAGLYSSARDMLTFASAHLNGREGPFKQALVDTLKARQDRPKEAPAIAWLIDDIGGQHITYQVGFVAGFTSYIGLNVEQRTAVVVLQNSFNWKDSVGQKLLLRMAHAKSIKLATGAPSSPPGP